MFYVKHKRRRYFRATTPQTNNLQFTVNGVAADLNNAYVVVIDDELFMSSPAASVGNIFRTDEGDLLRPGEEVILTDVKNNQTVYYETRGSELFVELNGEPIPAGQQFKVKTGGFLKLGVRKFTRNNFIRGWIA